MVNGVLPEYSGEGPPAFGLPFSAPANTGVETSNAKITALIRAIDALIFAPPLKQSSTVRHAASKTRQVTVIYRGALFIAWWLPLEMNRRPSENGCPLIDLPL